MKKIFSLFVVMFLVVGLAACSGGQTTECTTTTILITDSTGVDDRSFNQGAYEGLERFVEENKDQGACNAESIQASSEADYEPTLTSVSGKDNDLVVAAGITFEQAMSDVSRKFPDQKYLIIDTQIKLPNVVSADFAANEGSFLAGVAAAEHAKANGKDKVGFVGGMEIDVIKGFEAGYVQGVKAVDPDMKIDIKYVGNFTDATKGKTLATQMYKNGNYVIFIAAGGAGNGVINTAKELVQDQGEDVWVIGVDRDQYEDGMIDGDKSIILTSMVKRADVAAADVAKSVLDGTYEGGKTLVYDLSDGGVGLPEENPNLSDDIQKKVNDYKEKIINGEIKVNKK